MNETKSKICDKILNTLLELNGQGKSANNLANELGVDKNNILILCDILEKEGLLYSINTTTDEFDKVFIIGPKGKVKLEEGGFLKDFESELNIKKEEKYDKELNRKKTIWDIRKHIFWFVVQIITGIYFVGDLVLRAFFESNIIDVLLRFINFIFSIFS